MDVLISAIKEGIAPTIVIVVYLIISEYLSSKREKNQVKINSTFIDSINNISNFLIDINKNILDKDKMKCKFAIRDAFASSANKLNNFVVTTLITNHIDLNKKVILNNIHDIVNAEFYTVFTTLSLYKIDDVKASDNLKKEWMDTIEKYITDIIYNEELSRDDKILTFANKINITFSKYITYVINNTIK